VELSLLGSEGGWQDFTLGGGEWTVLLLSVAAALLAIGVGFYLARSVLAADQGTPKMREIAAAIQEGAAAYLKRQFRTIGVIIVPVAAVVFLTSTAIEKSDGSEALSFGQSGLFRTIAFVLGCLASGLAG
jgi:K(+)-stimulated pyrophosphate-energized sodium pump